MLPLRNINLVPRPVFSKVGSVELEILCFELINSCDSFCRSELTNSCDSFCFSQLYIYIFFLSSVFHDGSLYGEFIFGWCGDQK